jgi:hypothetical protein
MVLNRNGKTLRVLFARAGIALSPAAPGMLALQPGERLRWSTLPPESARRIVLAAPAEPVEVSSAQAGVSVN